MMTRKEMLKELDNLGQALKDSGMGLPDELDKPNYIPLDTALIEVWTVVELISEPAFIFNWSEDWELLWSKVVYVTEILWNVDDWDLLIYRINWMDEKDNNLCWVEITDGEIKKILAKVPYENLWKGFYKFKWNVYFNPNFDTSKAFSENDFITKSEKVKIINDTTIEIKDKKFKKTLKKNW